MNEARRGGGGWLTYGCGGCVGVICLLVVIATLVLGSAWNRAQERQVEEKVLERGLTQGEDAGDVPIDPDGTGPFRDGVAREVPVAPILPSSSGPAGTVILDLHHGEFDIRPGAPGEPLRVAAEFDPEGYELTDRFDEGTAEWSYRVSFRRKEAAGFMDALTRMFDSTSPRVRVLLPPDVPLALELDLGQGAGEVELGGLWVTSSVVSLNQGGFQVSIDEPLVVPMEELVVRGAMGGTEMEGIGNASPRKLDVDFSMGGMDLDLRGGWQQDAEIRIAGRMGGGSVRLPKDVVVRGLDNVEPGDDLEDDAPVLTFSVNSALGDVDVYQ